MSSKTDFKFSTHIANCIRNFHVHILQQQPNQRVQQQRNSEEEQTQTTKALIKLIDICMVPQTEPAGYSSFYGGIYQMYGEMSEGGDHGRQCSISLGIE